MSFAIKMIIVFIALCLYLVLIVHYSKRRRLISLKRMGTRDTPLLSSGDYALLCLCSKRAIDTKGDKTFVNCGLGSFVFIMLAGAFWGLWGAISEASRYGLTILQVKKAFFASQTGLTREELFVMQPIAVLAISVAGAIIMAVIWYWAVSEDTKGQLLGRIFVRLLELGDKNVPEHLRVIE